MLIVWNNGFDLCILTIVVVVTQCPEPRESAILANRYCENRVLFMELEDRKMVGIFGVLLSFSNLG